MYADIRHSVHVSIHVQLSWRNALSLRSMRHGFSTLALWSNPDRMKHRLTSQLNAKTTGYWLHPYDTALMAFSLVQWTFNNTEGPLWIASEVGIYNHLCRATNLFSSKSIWEWKVICITQSREDIPECHFHLNLLKSDYWRCRLAEQGINGLCYKVLGKGPEINHKQAQCNTDIHQIKAMLCIPH